MVLALFTMMLVFTLGVSYLMVGSSSMVYSRNDVLRAKALSCAEAGVNRAIQLLMADPPGVFRTDHPSSDPDDHASDDWYTESLDPSQSFRICVRGGTGIYAGKIVITSVGTAAQDRASISRTVKVIVDLTRENVSVWNNVIFGGVGQAGRSINGNVVIRGSVHLLGDGEDFTDLDGDGRWSAAEYFTDYNGNGKWDVGEPYSDSDHDGHYDVKEPFVDANGNGVYDPPLTVTDLAEEISGTANVGNNYSGMPSDLRALIPDPPQVSFGGQTIDSLSAKLRVKHGRVNVSGSATVGNPNYTANTYKETMDGVYVSDGFGGNKGASSVYSDNGTSNPYDLGDGAVELPLIDTCAYTKSGTTYDNYLSYLRKSATVYSGSLTVTKGVPFTISGPNGSLSMDASGNMSITGIVYVDGSISFGPSQSRITYSGSGTLVTPNSVYCHSDLVPKTGFPKTDALGLIARDRIELATGSGDAHLTMALAMYAQHQVICAKQCDIAGTIVASYYSMNNVPRIYQVPDLADYLPPGMPGGAPIWIANISVESWKDVLNPM